MTPTLHHTVNEETNGDIGHYIIVFGEEERDITEDNESPDEPGGELNKQDNKDNT